MQETNIQPIANEDLRNLPVLMAFAAWFYLVAPRKIVEIWGNYLAANLHYFSIPLLLRTLVAPWRKDSEGYGRGFDFARYARVFAMNLIARGIGFVIRSVIIMIGLAAEMFILVFGFLFLVFWLATPLVVAGIIVVSLWLLF